MRLDLAPQTRKRAIGLTPLIDVVFILLLFFMLASQFHQWRALTLNAPARGQAVSPAPAVLVRVHGEGRIDLDGDLIEPAGLSAKLADLKRLHPDLAVEVVSDPGVPLQALVTVFDRLDAAGISEMNLR